MSPVFPHVDATRGQDNLLAGGGQKIAESPRFKTTQNIKRFPEKRIREIAPDLVILDTV